MVPDRRWVAVDHGAGVGDGQPGNGGRVPSDS
jgi:hypothetical protein